MRSLMLHVMPDEGFDGRMQVALDLARHFDAHLTLVQPVSIEAGMPTDLYGAMPGQMVGALREAAEEYRGKVETRLRPEDVRWDWVTELGFADNSLLQNAALSDLVIVGNEASSAAGLLAIHGKAPVMVVPGSVNGLALDGPAMIAWDGSIEASRALRAAVPLLARASAVYLVTVVEDASGDNDFPAVRGAEYLSRHGIACEMAELRRGSSSVAGALQQEAARLGAVYMVMGAYGQARLVESLFGGVSRSLLGDTKVPLLIAH